MMPMRSAIMGKSAAEIRQLKEGLIKVDCVIGRHVLISFVFCWFGAFCLEEIRRPLTQADFDEALKKTSRSVGKDDIQKYERWMVEFGAS
jgi:hypothetical protein